MPCWRSAKDTGKLVLQRHNFPKCNPSFPLRVPPASPLPPLTGWPARWLCCLNLGVSWHQEAQAGWKMTRSSAAQMSHLGGKGQKRNVRWKEQPGLEEFEWKRSNEQRRDSPPRRKAKPTVAGAWGRAVWFVKPQFPRVWVSLSSTSSLKKNT